MKLNQSEKSLENLILEYLRHLPGCVAFKHESQGTWDCKRGVRRKSNNPRIVKNKNPIYWFVMGVIVACWFTGCSTLKDAYQTSKGLTQDYVEFKTIDVRLKYKRQIAKLEEKMAKLEVLKKKKIGVARERVSLKIRSLKRKKKFLEKQQEKIAPKSSESESEGI